MLLGAGWGTEGVIVLGETRPMSLGLSYFIRCRPVSDLVHLDMSNDGRLMSFGFQVVKWIGVLMSKRFLPVILAAGLHASVAQAAIVVADATYADNAVVDQLLGYSGAFTTSGGPLASVITDRDAGTYAFSFSAGAQLTLGWAGRQAFNGIGADIDLYELGTPNALSVTINGISRSFTSVATSSSLGYALNRVSIDLSDFGVASGAGIGSLVIGMAGSASSVPTLSLVAARQISVVPENGTVALMALGLAGLILSVRRRA